jgi:hypothetical protein
MLLASRHRRQGVVHIADERLNLLRLGVLRTKACDDPTDLAQQATGDGDERHELCGVLRLEPAGELVDLVAKPAQELRYKEYCRRARAPPASRPGAR